MSFMILHPSPFELAALRRSPFACEAITNSGECGNPAVAAAATIAAERVTEVFPVCAVHVLPRWASDSWRLVPLADLIGGDSRG